MSALRDAGALVAPFHEHFDPGMKDEDLLPRVAERGWVFLTKDGNIRRRPLEVEALRSSRLRVVIVTGGNLTGDELARLLAGALTRIERLCRNHQPPVIIRVTRPGAVDVLETLKRGQRPG